MRASVTVGWLALASSAVAAYNRTLGLGNGLTLNPCNGSYAPSTATSTSTGVAGIVDQVAAAVSGSTQCWSTADDQRLNALGNKVEVSTAHTPGASFSFTCDGCTSFYLLGWREANQGKVDVSLNGVFSDTVDMCVPQEATTYVPGSIQ